MAARAAARAAPPCCACGEPVFDAEPGVDPYHEMCRRCSSCMQVVSSEDSVLLVGRLLCKQCDQLFGKFFLPGRRGEAARMKEIFNAWDADGSGTIDKSEMRRVLKAINANLSEGDLGRLIDCVDTNNNGSIEYEEFVDWMMGGDPLGLPQEDSFEGLVSKLMHDAGVSASVAKMGIAEVQMRPDGLFFLRHCGTEVRQCGAALKAERFDMLVLAPEEFLCGVESTEEGLHLTTNTGKRHLLRCQGQLFGPWSAPDGFRIVGLRTKPDDAAAGLRVVGVNLWPLPSARNYDTGAALLFASEHEFLYTLQRLLSQAQIDVNGFGLGGVTGLMMAAQNGNVGAMRMLLGSKAKPNLTDGEGWTALAYAIHSGNQVAVEVLLDGGAVQDGDSGAALRSALRHEHNSAARALLRAGFGTAPAGTFSLEDFLDPSKCTLEPPVMQPPAGVFAKPVLLEIRWKKAADEDEESEVSREGPLHGGGSDTEGEGAPPPPPPKSKAPAWPPEDKVEIFYTLDGRDPCTAGKRYRKPVRLCQQRTRVRAVAVFGKHRSVAVDSVYVVSHYVLPDAVVTGQLQARTFPEGLHAIAKSIASMIGEAEERVHVQPTEVETEEKQSKEIWIRVPLSLPRRRSHMLRLDRPFSIARGAQKTKFLDKLTSDIEKATGERPTNLKPYADTSSAGGASHKTGSLVVELDISWETAQLITEQLQDPGSSLMTINTLYVDAELQMVDPLGKRLGDPDLHAKVQSAIALPTKEVVGVGTDFFSDTGVLAVAVACSSSKPAKNAQAIEKVKSKLVATVKELMSDTEQGELRESPATLLAAFTVDVLIGHRVLVQSKPLRRLSAVASDTLDRRRLKNVDTVVRELNAPDCGEKLMAELTDIGFSASVTPLDKAASRGLSKLEFNLQGGSSKTGSGLDGICMVYEGGRLMQIVDFKSASEGAMVYDGEESEESASLARAVARAVRHGGGARPESGGALCVEVDLSALPLQVTDLYFALAAFEARGPPRLQGSKVTVLDAACGRVLTEYSLDSACESRAAVMCSLSRDPDHRKWVVHGLGLKSGGSAKDYGPIRETIAARQAGYLRWERRAAIVIIRTLYKLDRVKKGSRNNFASLLWGVMELPTSLFQMLCSWL